MNILTDILSLIKRKQYIKELKPHDVIVVGIHEEPEITGIASPIPYKNVKLIKAIDLAVKFDSCDFINTPAGDETWPGVFKEKSIDPVTGECFVSLRRLKSLSLNLDIQSNGDFIEFSTTAEPNAAENIDCGGVGVYADKVGEVLRFKSLISPDSSILITDNNGCIELLSNITPQTYNFESGLTLTGDTVRWNGDLLENVLIGGQETYQVNFGLFGNSVAGFGVWSNGDIYLYLDAPFNNTGIVLQQSTQNITLYSQNNISASCVGNIEFLPAGDVLINTNISAGYKLDVNGTARVQSDLEIDGVLRETITRSVQTVSNFYTLVITDRGKLVDMTFAGANTVIIPNNAAVPFPIGTKIDVIQGGVGQTSFLAGVGVLLYSANSFVNLSAQYSAATLIKIATDEWYLIGDLS